MSQHSSLRSSDKDKQVRSVLKRYERIKILKDKEKWKAEESVYGLPKVKVTRFKIKKEKAVAAAEGVPAAPGTEATVATPQAKAAPAGKAAGIKEGASLKGGAEKKQAK